MKNIFIVLTAAVLLSLSLNSCTVDASSAVQSGYEFSDRLTETEEAGDGFHRISFSPKTEIFLNSFERKTLDSIDIKVLSVVPNEWIQCPDDEEIDYALGHRYGTTDQSGNNFREKISFCCLYKVAPDFKLDIDFYTDYISRGNRSAIKDYKAEKIKTDEGYDCVSYYRDAGKEYDVCIYNIYVRISDEYILNIRYSVPEIQRYLAEKSLATLKAVGDD